MRERSGRSGRRRGSQKPGTAWGAASCFAAGAGVGCAAGLGAVWACAKAGPLDSASTMAVAPARRAAKDDRAMGNKVVCNGLAGLCLDVEGLIDHPEPDASGVFGERLGAPDRPKYGIGDLGSLNVAVAADELVGLEIVDLFGHELVGFGLRQQR